MVDYWDMMTVFGRVMYANEEVEHEPDKYMIDCKKNGNTLQWFHF